MYSLTSFYILVIIKLNNIRHLLFTKYKQQRVTAILIIDHYHKYLNRVIELLAGEPRRFVKWWDCYISQHSPSITTFDKPKLTTYLLNKLLPKGLVNPSANWFTVEIYSNLIRPSSTFCFTKLHFTSICFNLF